MYKLISATPSPYARKVRIALHEKNIAFELITEVPWDSTTQTPQHNPLEKLPVLVLADPSNSDTNGHRETGRKTKIPAPTAIYESRYVLEWLEAKHPTPSLMPDTIDARLFARQIEVLCDGICDALVLRFFERQRGEGRVSAEWEARQLRKVNGGMRQLNAWVEECGADERGSLIGDRFGLADLAVGCVCGYLDVRWREYGWRGEYPRLAEYVDGLQGRESFRKTVPRAQDIKDKIV
ncbi:glutathione S-transferase domain-containing protein [Saccharata proteae CBS 121410]|uniref:Glutathione S-transferase domain-containing protein n=1 Tax=Saccharata proteae CBS 121410 TaxID=1314787 RepID=A0A9P4I2H4_9PEZI|nr:glutathione S-transferase domain-containing protein [Saccharata proteae CBS 121410]